MHLSKPHPGGQYKLKMRHDDNTHTVNSQVHRLLLHCPIICFQLQFLHISDKILNTQLCCVQYKHDLTTRNFTLLAKNPYASPQPPFSATYATQHPPQVAIYYMIKLNTPTSQPPFQSTWTDHGAAIHYQWLLVLAPFNTSYNTNGYDCNYNSTSNRFDKLTSCIISC